MEKDFCQQTGRKPQNARSQIAGYGHAQATKVNHDANKNAKNKLQKYSGGAIIKEQSKKPITKITDGAINNVSRVDIPTYTDEQNEFIRQQHKELLKYSKDNNDSNEVGFLFNSQFGNRKIYAGTDEDFSVPLSQISANSILMHNHPRNSSFSLNDLKTFINSEMKTITIVKNNGSIETLTKTLDYAQYKEIFIALNRIGKKTNIDKNISKLLAKLQREEILQWIK